MTEQLKPCPFCGGAVETGYYAEQFVIECPTCNFTVSSYDDGPNDPSIKGLRHWNNRPTQPVSREAIADAICKAHKEWCDPWNFKKDPAYKGERLPDWPDYLADAVLSLTPAPVVPARRVKHIKRGSTYKVIAEGKIQTDRPLSDYAEVTIYSGESDGMVWVRPIDEFEDPERFEVLPPTEQPDPLKAAVSILRCPEQFERLLEMIFDSPSDVSRARLDDALRALSAEGDQ